MIPYVSLHNRTSFSIMQALVTPNELFERAKELNQPAVAVCDVNSMAGLWDAYKASKNTGVKLIAGVQLSFVNDITQEGEQLRNIVLLAKNAVGYKNLLTLAKKGYDNFIIVFKKATPRIDWKLLKEHSEGVICLTGCGNGIISQLLMKRDFAGAKDQLIKLKEIFKDNLAVELQPHALSRKATGYSGEVDQNFLNIQLAKLAKELDIRCVVATDSHYLNKEHHKAHNVLLAIGSGQPIGSGNRLTYNVQEFYVKSAIEVAQYFIRLKSIYSPEFIQSLFENTIYFADQCEEPAWIDPKFTNATGKELPEFPVKNQTDYNEFNIWLKEQKDLPVNLAEDAAYMRYRCELGFAKLVPAGKEKEYRERLTEELDVLEFHGFSSYMLIVADFIEWAKANKIRTSPGRGSIGNSVVAYLLLIHSADSVKYNLVFSRFHNKLRTSYPDADLDLPTSKRHLVQEYLQRKYGADYVASVSNVNKITPKVYIKDIARTFEFGGDRMAAAKIGQIISDLVPAEYHNIKKAADAIPLFEEYTKQYPQLLEFADLICNKPRAFSTHAAGLIIAKRPLVGLVPVRRDKDGAFVVEYDKDKAEENGLVKMDLLGIETLDIIQNTYDLIESVGKPNPPDPPNFEMPDEKTYNLIGEGKTFGMFQLAGTAVNVCKKIQPKNILDISNITALIRPSAESFRDDFISVRRGEKKLQLPHPKLENAFKVSGGFALYDDILIYLAHDIAGWDLHEADSLRKITKDKGKNPEKAKKAKEKFIKDAQERKGLTKDEAKMIWDKVVGEFAAYGFCLSHALLYSILTYYTAYLKANYTIEFLVANLMSQSGSAKPDAKDNILRIKDEIRQLGVKVVPPDINTSLQTYKIIDDKTLMTGLNALKFMGKDSMPEIIAKRPFISIQDFLTKVDAKKVRAGAIQAMAASGCLDSFGMTRKNMFLYAADFKKKLGVYLKKKPEKRPPEFIYPWPENEEWSKKELYALESKFLGEGISGTIAERYEGFFNRARSFMEYVKKYQYIDIPLPQEPLKTKKDKEAFEKSKRYANTHVISEPVTGVLTSVFAFKVKKEDSKIFGQEMARLSVQDIHGNEFSTVAFPSNWEAMKETIDRLSGGKPIAAGMAIKFNGSFSLDSGSNYQFILGDIVGYRDAPSLPTDLKGKSIKIPRGKKEIINIETVDKKELFEDLDDELIEDGFNLEDEEEFE